MDILLLNWKDTKNPKAGGAEVIAFELAKRLVEKGNSVTFFTTQFKNSLSEEIVDGIKVIRKGGRLSVYFYAFLYYVRLKAKPDRVIDMINTIGWFTPLYVVREKRVAYLNQLANEVWFYEFPWLFAVIGYIFERLQYLLYRSTPFLCYSKSTKQDLISFGIPKENIRTFVVGIDQKRYTPGRKANYPLFIFVARLVRMKRADLCIEAIKIVCKKHPSIKLAIIGNGKEETSLVEMVKKLSLVKNVFFVSKNNFFFKKNQKDIKVKLMKQAWGLLLPSVKEGWGLVVTEAGACGTLSIVSGVTGLKDSVIDGKTGFVLSPNPRAQEIAQTISTCIEDRMKRVHMEKNAREYALKFTWEKSFKEFYGILQSL